MLIEAVAAILDRDLQALAREVAAYPDERAPWETPSGIANSAGTLALHLAGGARLLLIEFGEWSGLRKNWIAGGVGAGVLAGLAFALALIG